MVLDAERMQWLEQNVDIEIGREDDDGDTVRVVYRVSGSRNDRQWTPIGRGSTLTAAIDAARAIYDASRIAAPAKAARIERLSERQKEVLRRGAEGLSLRGKYQWICAGEPATREVNALVKRKLMRIGEFGGGRAAANATDAGREALAATTHRN
ncbi:response regulator transcription factor [Noviherbaspirillum pedocola]|uniref:Uncharacterized protein n=1 Tax=Noviherbaspirillum pedocola TaxID=2801341 RepID=A0A934W8R0_9BURK|nr:hypothetical protein [Noviherbaspirillum pedocola]MBK4736119.1 hypothetical protein [Noviherbaspirillum pedocola]